MKPHRVHRYVFYPLIGLSLFISTSVIAQPRNRVPAGGRVAVVVDDRLSALRAAPDLSGKLLQRIGRGRYVAILGRAKTGDGITFYSVKVSTRRRGWIQKDAVVLPDVRGDDERLLALILASRDFDRLSRATIFLKIFPNSRLRPEALLVYAEAAEAAAAKLSRDAARSFGSEDLMQNGVAEFSYFLNYKGLDRYNRQGIRFVFDRQTRKFHYRGFAWQEIMRRYPRSAAAVTARKRLQALSTPISIPN